MFLHRFQSRIVLHRSTEQIIKVFFSCCRISIIHSLEDFIHIQVIPCNIIDMKAFIFMRLVITGDFYQFFFLIFFAFWQFPIMILEPKNKILLSFLFIPKSFQHDQDDYGKNHSGKYDIFHLSPHFCAASASASLSMPHGHKLESYNSHSVLSVSMIRSLYLFPTDVVLYFPIYSYFSHICMGKTISAAVCSKK